MRKESQLAICALLIVLGGCAPGMFNAVNPNSQSPPTSYATWSPMKGCKLVSSKDCQTLLPATFGQNELSLAELIDIALQNNPSTKQTWAQARSAAGVYGQSLSNYYPNIQFDGTYIRQRGSTPGLQGSSTSPNSTATSQSIASFPGAAPATYMTSASPDLLVTYTLLDFGVRSSVAEMARQALYYADMTHNQQIQTILQIVMNDYYYYLYQSAILRSDSANLENAQASLDAANQRFALGLSALGDVAQARTQFLQSKINLTNQKQAVENAFAQLAVDLGLPANIPFKVQPMPEQVVADPLLASVDALVEMAQTQRQDFLASQANVRSKVAALKYAKAQVYPILNGTFDIGRTWYKVDQNDQYHFAAEMSLSFPIFAGFYYKNGIRKAHADLDNARAQMMQTELNVIQHVTTAHMGVKTAAENLHSTDEYLAAAELEFDIGLQSYKAGTATILDVLSAQSSLSDARSKKAGSQFQWFSSLAAIAYATGSLCSDPFCCQPTEEPCD